MADELLATKLANFDSGDPVLTMSQLVTGLGVSEDTIQNWIKTRTLLAWRTASGRYIMTRASLARLVPPDTLEQAHLKILERAALERPKAQSTGNDVE